MKNLLVPENYWKYFLLIASIIVLQLTTGIQKNVPLLDEVDDAYTVFT